MSVAFTVPGAPRGKGRPRFGNGRTYTDAATASYENLVKINAVMAMGARTLLAGPLEVIVFARFTPPASASKSKRSAMLAGQIMPTGKPDLDNMVKVLDALNAIVFKDDAQIVRLVAHKTYTEIPGLDITVREISPVTAKPSLEAS